MTNLWFALQVLEELGFDKSRCIQNLDTITLYPAGRFEVFRNPDKPTVIVDYAHTPEGLQHVLASANNIRPDKGRLIVVFGCGGGRDFEKRINMGQIASQMADYVYVTDDNPRDAEIRRMVISGMNKEFENYSEIPDRSTAIRTAITEASSQDIVVIAGKGDEQSQTYGDKVLPFDDRDEVEKSLSLNT
jgi:UDP-N-acetylmuramoyl-L-alanyl-D-glutamate--2,6-diaminopimelate ligase